MTQFNCLFCDSIVDDKKSYNYYLNFLNKYYYYYKCKKCHVNFINPVPDAKDLEKIYSTQYYSDFYLKNIVEDYEFKFFYKRIEKYLNLSDLVLDLGCGDGKFLKLLNKKKIETFGCDFPSKILNNLKNENYNVFTFDRLKQHRNKFNLIYLRDVFEHSTNPNKLINEISECLKSDGYLVIDGPVEKNFSITNQVIDLNIYIKRKLGIFNSNNAPYHITLYNKSQLLNFLNKMNYTVVKYFLYETGWPLINSSFIKKIIARFSIMISKIFFLNKFYGNRCLVVLKKNEK